MKKIGLVIRLLGNRSGGAERLYCELANWLVQEGYEVHCLYCESGDGKPFYDIDKKVRMVNLWIPYKSRSITTKFYDLVAAKDSSSKIMSYFGFLSKHNEFSKCLGNYIKYNSLDLTISLLPPANTPLLLSKRYHNSKIIVTNHNVPEQDYENKNRWSKNPYDILMRKKLLSRADKIHVLFESFKNWFEPDLSGRITVIENYISDSYFSILPEPEALYQKKRLIAVGRLADVKNYHVLIESWSKIHLKHPDWILVIFGKGPDSVKLKDMCQKLNLGNSVVLAGHTKNIYEEYKKSSILCHPALYEGFGLSVAEGLACGLPVVAFSDCEGVNQFVFNDVNGIMCDRSHSNGVNEFSEALEKLINNKKIYLDLSEKSQSSVKVFSEVKYYEKWKKLIEELI